jgi:Cytochrome oxidase complex assembly protein 1
VNINPQSAMPHPPASQPAPKGWLARNWIKLLAGVFLFLLLLGFGIFALVMGAIRSSDAATESVLRAQSNPLIVQLLGSPIKEGWFVGGSINVTTDAGDADLSVPISGPKGEGTVYVTGHKSAGTWSYSQMLAAIEGSSEKIDLLVSATAVSNSGANTARAAQPSQAAPESQSQAAPARQPADASVVGPAAMAARAPAPSAPAAPASDVIQSEDSNAPGTVGELIQCKRSEGVLSVKVRFHNTSGKAVEFDIFHGGNDSEREKAFITAANKKYFLLKDSGGEYLTSQGEGGGLKVKLDPGQSFTWWAKFPAPPAEVKKINLMTPITPPFEDVPITDK